MNNPTIRQILATQPVNSELVVQGWVRTRRDSGGLSFVEVTDGSCLAGLQVVAEADLEEVWDAG